MAAAAAAAAAAADLVHVEALGPEAGLGELEELQGLEVLRQAQPAAPGRRPSERAVDARQERTARCARRGQGKVRRVS